MTQEDGRHTLVFPSVNEVRSYLAATIAMSHLVDRVPDFEGSLRTTRRFAVFTAREPIRS